VDRRSYPRQRQGQKLTLGGNTYNIVAISEADVTLEDQATKKRTTLRWKPAP
jgi:Lhr-like helicase